jgi:protein MAK16
LREHLRKGVYGDIYNIDFTKFKDILEMEKDEKVHVENE